MKSLLEIDILGYRWRVRRRERLLILGSAPPLARDAAKWAEHADASDSDRVRRRTLLCGAMAAYAQAPGVTGDLRAVLVALDVETDGPLFVLSEIGAFTGAEDGDYVITYEAIP